MKMPKCSVCKSELEYSPYWSKKGPWTCSDKCLETLEYRRTSKTQEKYDEKMERIKAINARCPACLKDFSMCPDYALTIIFQISHIHGSKCPDRATNDDWFVSCQRCNVQQSNTCGKYDNGLFFRGH